MINFTSIMEESDRRPKKQNREIIDENIFIKIANNDKEAFEQFYNITQRCLYAYVLSILKNHEDTLDVVQDTYLKIRSAAHLYKPMGKPYAWIFTIAHNLAMSNLRSKKHLDSFQSEEIENNLSFSYVTDKTDKMILELALTILDEAERKIILLHAISGFTFKEIAKDLKLPLSTVLSKYHRGLKKMKKFLTEKEVLL